MINSEEKYRLTEHDPPPRLAESSVSHPGALPWTFLPATPQPHTWEEQFSANLFHGMFSTAALSMPALAASGAQLTQCSACDGSLGAL